VDQPWKEGSALWLCVNSSPSYRASPAIFDHN